MEKTNQLLNSNPFDLKNSQLFIDSIRETSAHHYKNNKLIKNFWDQQNFSPDMIQSEKDLINIPYLMVHLFKENEIFTGSRKDIVLNLTSSGTGGQKSQIFLNQQSLDNVKQLAFNVYDQLGICDPQQKYNYLCFTYDPNVADDLGTAFTDELLTSFTDKNEVFYAIKWDKTTNDWKLDEEYVVEMLQKAQNNPIPLRILGFPAFLYEIINKHNINIKLPSNSWLLTGGGWKNAQDKSISKTDFREFISKRLGIIKENQRDLFGMVEHGVPYVDNSEGNLQIPNYSRVFIRDPKTLAILPDGEIGLIQFLCSYNTSYPNMSILTTDWGHIKTDGPSKALFINGRAGMSKHKGCALKANELLKN